MPNSVNHIFSGSANRAESVDPPQTAVSVAATVLTQLSLANSTVSSRLKSTKLEATGFNWNKQCNVVMFEAKSLPEAQLSAAVLSSQ